MSQEPWPRRGSLRDWIHKRHEEGKQKREEHKQQRRVERQAEDKAYHEAYSKQRIVEAGRRGRERARQTSRPTSQRIGNVFSALSRGAEASNRLLWGEQKGKSQIPDSSPILGKPSKKRKKR